MQSFKIRIPPINQFYVDENRRVQAVIVSRSHRLDYCVDFVIACTVNYCIEALPPALYNRHFFDLHILWVAAVQLKKIKVANCLADSTLPTNYNWSSTWRIKWVFRSHREFYFCLATKSHHSLRGGFVVFTVILVICTWLGDYLWRVKVFMTLWLAQS